MRTIVQRSSMDEMEKAREDLTARGWVQKGKITTNKRSTKQFKYDSNKLKNHQRQFEGVDQYTTFIAVFEKL